MDTITLSYDIPVPRAAAFYLFVGEIAQWWPGVHTPHPTRFRGMSIDARPGGAVLVHGQGQTDMPWGDVVEVRPPELIVMRCFWRSDVTRPTLVTVRFQDSEWGTRVTFEHSGFAVGGAPARSRFVEWPLILSHYVDHARRHVRAGLARSVGRGVA